MTTIAEVGVRFVGDPGSLLSSAKQAGTTAGTQAGESFGSAFNEASKRLLAGFVGAEAILKTVEFVRSSLDVAREAQVAWSRLSTTLEANVKGWDGNTEAIKRQIDAAEKLGFKESDVLASITPLVGATKSVTEAINVQNVAMDLARYTGHSLQEATDTLTKFEAGRFRGLAQLGVQIDAHATKEQALAAVERIAHGQAETYAQQDASAQDRLDSAVEKLQIDVGTKLLPAVTGFTNFLRTGVIPAVSTTFDVMEKIGPLLEALAITLTVRVVGGFIAARVAALGFGGAAVTAGAETAVATTEIEGATVATKGFSLALDAIPLFLVIAGITQLVQELGDLGNTMNLFSSDDVTKTKAAMQALTDQFGVNADSSGFLGDRYRELKAHLDTLTGATGTQSDAFDHGTTELNAYNDAIGASTDAIDTNTSALGPNTDQTEGNAAGQRDLTSATADATDAADGQTAALGYLDGALSSTEQGARLGGSATSNFAAALQAAYGITISEADAALFLARGMTAAGAAAQYAAAGIAAFRAGHPTNPNLPGTADSQVQFNMGSVNTTDAAFDPQALAQHNTGLGANYGYVAPKKTTGGGRGSGRGRGSGSASTAAATAATQALAATTRTDLTAAFNAAKTTADALFAGIRDKSIASAQTVHDTLVKQIGTDLKNAYNAAERAANEAKRAWDSEKAGFFTQANADQQAFALHQLDEQRAQLVQSQSDASNALQQNTDPAQVDQLTRAYSQATQALADFSEQQRIAGEQADAQKRADALDASHQAIDPVTGAATTDIDLALAKAKSAADAIATQKTTAADADLKRAKTAADNLYTQQSKDFDAALALVQKHLVDVKGAHSKAIAEIDALYVKFGISAKKHGANIAIGVADGLLSEIKSVEKAAESLAAAVNKYIVTHSPAEAGPWAVDPPSASGARAGRQFAAAMAREVAPALLALTQGGTGLFAAPDVFRGLAATAGPAQGFAGAAERAGHQLHFTINNPAPEPAGQSATRTLQLIADQLDG